MDKSIKTIVVVLISILFLYFIIWNWNVNIGIYQFLAIFIVILVVVIVIVLFYFLQNLHSNSIIGKKSEFITVSKNCSKMWSDLTYGHDELTVIGSEMRKRIFFPGTNKKMSVYACIFTKKEMALSKIIIYYHIEARDIIANIENPSVDQLLNPFKFYNPYDEDEVFDNNNKRFTKTGGTYINFNEKQDGKLKLDNETEEGKNSAR